MDTLETDTIQVLDIAQAIALSIATKYGYGSHIDTLNDASLARIMKSQYAQHILLIASLACAKISLIMLINSITAASVDYKMSWGLLIIIWIWAAICIIVTALQCRPPHVWDYLSGQCYNLVRLQLLINILSHQCHFSNTGRLKKKILTTCWVYCLILGSMGELPQHIEYHHRIGNYRLHIANHCSNPYIT